MNAYAIGMGCANALVRWVDLVMLHHPETDFCFVDGATKIDEVKTGKDYWYTVITRVAWLRLKWFGNLWIASRYVML